MRRRSPRPVKDTGTFVKDTAHCAPLCGISSRVPSPPPSGLKLASGTAADRPPGVAALPTTRRRRADAHDILQPSSIAQLRGFSPCACVLLEGRSLMLFPGDGLGWSDAGATARSRQRWPPSEDSP